MTRRSSVRKELAGAAVDAVVSQPRLEHEAENDVPRSLRGGADVGLLLRWYRVAAGQGLRSLLVERFVGQGRFPKV